MEHLSRKFVLVGRGAFKFGDPGDDNPHTFKNIGENIKVKTEVRDS